MGLFMTMREEKMRGKKRIKRILGLIEKIWSKNPDLRLLQLIYHCFPVGKTGYIFDLFYTEDTELEEKINTTYREDLC